MYFKLLCVAVFLAELVIAGDVDYRLCDTHTPQCNVTRVDIYRCSQGRVCSLKKGVPTELQIDFTPHFFANGDDLYAMVFEMRNDDSIHRLNADEIDVCQLTQCPFLAGRAQTLTYNITLSKKRRMDIFVLGFLIEDSEHSNECCFETTAYTN